MKNFSVVLPTYTGVNTVDQTLDSLLGQQFISVKYEVIVVIDGPNQVIREIIDSKANHFKVKQIPFKVEQFSQNRGRFEARKMGAELAKFDQILFVDDRVHLADDYFKILAGAKEAVVMANVQEDFGRQSNVISQTMFLIRRRLFRDKFGLDFQDYYIDNSNFEISPKGTTSLWIAKDIFLRACQQIQSKDFSKYTNEDTKILKAVVSNGYRIFRPSRLMAIYKPRSDLKSAIKHLYERGPRFVDYYSRPGTRFFPVLLAIISLPVIAILTVITLGESFYLTIVALIVIISLAALGLARNTRELLTAMVGLILVGIVFSMGVYKGVALKIKEAIF